MRSSFTSSFRGYVLRWTGTLSGLLLVFALASVALVKYAVEPNDTLVSRLELIRQGSARNAAFGDSHVVWGIMGSPDFLTLGTEGETIPDMELRVHYYFRDKSPGKVIIQGDPHSFSPYKLERGTHAYLHDMGASFWERFASHHRQYLGEYWKRVIAERSVHVFRPKHEIRWGWVPGKERWSSVDAVARVRRAASRVVRQTPVENFDGHAFAESYRRNLSFLRQRGAEVCVVTMPVSYDYYVQAKDIPATVNAIEFFASAASQHGARHVNFYGHYAEPEFNGYFVDEDHLNELGASRFTGEVVSACFGGGRAGTAQGRTPASMRPGG